jgi:phosphoribosyl-AMP cyclohydrolase / phosphoribosyl-ATP pyrophosphohydrolase
MKEIKFDVQTGLAPAVVQDAVSGQVLMLAYMNADAVKQTQETGLVTFYSRSRQELWVKGETSGNFLKFVSLSVDCDADALLVKANPVGPVCHTGSYTCWDEEKLKVPELGFLKQLESVIHQRRTQSPETSYVARLFSKGINKIAQKVGEEAVEVVIESKDHNDDLFLNEAADLVFHLMVLLEAKDKGLDDVVTVLKGRVR